MAVAAISGLLDACGVSVLDLAEAGARRAGGLLDIAAAARRGLLDTAAAVDRGTVTSVLGETTAACLFDIAAGA